MPNADDIAALLEFAETLAARIIGRPMEEGESEGELGQRDLS